MDLNVKTALLVASLAGGLALSGGARELLPRAAPESVGLDSSRLRTATALLNQFVTDKRIAGAVAAVARKGKLAYLEPIGVQNLETRAPMTLMTQNVPSNPDGIRQKFKALVQQAVVN